MRTQLHYIAIVNTVSQEAGRLMRAGGFSGIDSISMRKPEKIKLTMSTDEPASRKKIDQGKSLLEEAYRKARIDLVSIKFLEQIVVE